MPRGIRDLVASIFFWKKMNVAKIVSLYISRGGLVERDPKNSNDRKKSSSRSLRVRRPQIKKKIDY